MAKEILLNPGPTNTSFWTKLKQWLGSDTCHRTEKFSKDFNTLQEKILERFGESFLRKVAIMGGSGTTALDAMISTLMPVGTLIVDAGSYGRRACEIAGAYRVMHRIVQSETIEDLQYDPTVKYVYFVENETSTGEKYDLQTMCLLYPNARFFIDATSSFGAHNYAKDQNRIAAISFCSNKCLQSTPGLGIVIWDKTLETHTRSFYGDLTKYGKNKMPFTVPVQSVYALLHAIDESKDNEKLFNARCGRLIVSMKELGIRCISRNPCNSVVAFVHPTRTYEELRDYLAKKNIIIYSGVPGIKNSFRLSTMSVQFDRKYKKIIGAFRDSRVH